MMIGYILTLAMVLAVGMMVGAVLWEDSHGEGDEDDGKRNRKR